MHRPHRVPSSWGDLARTVAGVETRYRERHPRSARRHENATRHLERGYYVARRGYIALSLPTTESDCDGFVHVVDDFFAARGALIRSAFT
jgi:hypothetical protein